MNDNTNTWKRRSQSRRRRILSDMEYANIFVEALECNGGKLALDAGTGPTWPTRIPNRKRDVVLSLLVQQKRIALTKREVPLFPNSWKSVDTVTFAVLLANPQRPGTDGQ